MDTKTDTFDAVRLSRWHLLVNRHFAKTILQAPLLPDYFDGVRGPFTTVAASKFARVFKCRVNFASRPQNVFCKQYLYRSVVDFLKHLVRPSRGQRAMNAAVMLNQHDLGTPEVIALGHKKIAGVCVNTFIITRSVEDAKPLYECIPIIANASISVRHRFLRELGETIGRMHEAGIFHGDLRAGNILVKEAGPYWKFYLLDNERTKKFNTLPRKLRVKNLVQINMLPSKLINRTDRMRFFKSYLKAHKTPISKPKQLVRNAAEKTIIRLSKKTYSDPS